MASHYPLLRNTKGVKRASAIIFFKSARNKRLGEWKLVDNAANSISYMKRDVICSLTLLCSNGEIYYFQRFSYSFLGRYRDKLLKHISSENMSDLHDS